MSVIIFQEEDRQLESTYATRLANYSLPPNREHPRKLGDYQPRCLNSAPNSDHGFQSSNLPTPTMEDDVVYVYNGKQTVQETDNFSQSVADNKYRLVCKYIDGVSFVIFFLVWLGLTVTFFVLIARWCEVMKYDPNCLQSRLRWPCDTFENIWTMTKALVIVYFDTLFPLCSMWRF